MRGGVEGMSHACDGAERPLPALLAGRPCHPSPASHDAVGGWSLVELCSPQNRAVDVAVSFLKAVQATAMSGREFGARSMRSAQVPAGV